MEHESVIETSDVRVRFGRSDVLGGVDLVVPRGSVTALVGCNGAGKSTLLRVLVGALVPDAGTVRVLGVDPTNDGARVRSMVGYVPDRIDVPSRTRGSEWLAFVARFYPIWSADEERRWIELLAFDPRERVAEMSKGARTKLALVAALAHSPRILLLDEPFSGLDVGTRLAITTAVLSSLSDESRTVLLVSHSIPDVERVADRIAVLDQGRIECCGELEDVGRTERGRIDLESALSTLPRARGAA